MSRRVLRGAAAGAVLALAAAGLVSAQQETSAPQSSATPATPQPAQGPVNTLDAAAPPDEAPAPSPVQPATPRPPAPPAPPPKPAEPLKRTRHDAAILQAVDKITAETLRFEARVNAPVRYKDLVITVHACETTAPDEPSQDSVAHLEVVSQPTAAPGRAAVQPRQLFRGWMFASSPAVHPFTSPVYDLWLIACRTVSPPASGGRA